MSINFCGNDYKAECQALICLNDWGFEANHPDYEQHQEFVELCKPPGLGGAYAQCGLCTKFYDYSSCCDAGSVADNYNCMESFVKKETACGTYQTFLSSLGVALTSSGTRAGSAVPSSNAASSTATSSQSVMSMSSSMTSQSSTMAMTSMSSTAHSITAMPTSAMSTAANSPTASPTTSGSSGAISNINMPLAGLLLLVTCLVQSLPIRLPAI